MEKRPPVYVFKIQTPKRTATIRLEGPCFVLGRGEPYRIFHDDPTLSREHLALVDTEDGYRVKDLGSRNGVLLNGKRLGRYAEATLKLGDTLLAGQTRVRLMLQQEAAAEAAQEGSSEELTVDATGKSSAVRTASDGAEDLEGEVTAELDRPDVLEAAADYVDMEVTQCEDEHEDLQNPEATQFAMDDDDEDLELLGEDDELTFREEAPDSVADLAEAIDAASMKTIAAKSASEDSDSSGLALEQLAADLGVTPDELEADVEEELLE